jgi:hypothetical protein
MTKNNSESTNVEDANFFDLPRMTFEEIKSELLTNSENPLYRRIHCVDGGVGLGKSQNEISRLFAKIFPPMGREEI